MAHIHIKDKSQMAVDGSGFFCRLSIIAHGTPTEAVWWPVLVTSIAPPNFKVDGAVRVIFTVVCEMITVT